MSNKFIGIPIEKDYKNIFKQAVLELDDNQIYTI